MGYEISNAEYELLEELRFLWRQYALAPDLQLTPEALKLKDALLVLDKHCDLTEIKC